MAIRSDGSSTQHIAGPSGSSPSSGDVTLLQWHKLNVDANTQKTLFKYHNNAGQEFGFYTNTDGTSLITVTINGGGIGEQDTNVQAIAIGTWYYYAITRSGSAINIYVGTESSGVSLISTLTDAALDGQSANWRWTSTGASGAGFSADASIAQFRLYNRLLTTVQIDAERVSATPVSSTNLWTSNPFDADGSLGADAGSNQWTFTEQGNSNFSTVAGPAPLTNRVLDVAGSSYALTGTAATLVQSSTVLWLRHRA